MIELLVSTTRINAPAAIILALMSGAGALFCVRGRAAAWTIGLSTSAIVAAVALDLAQRLALRQGVRLAETGLAVTIDGIGSFAAAIIAVLLCCIVLTAALRQRDAAATDQSRTAPLELALILLCACGWCVSAFASDIVGLFLGAEIGWIASVGLVAGGASGDRARLNAALRMLMLGGVAGAALLFGAALLAHATGSLDLSALAREPEDSGAVAALGLGLVILALAMMAGAAPLHAWVGPAFGRGEAVASLTVSAIGVTGAVSALARLAACGATSPALGDRLSLALIVLGMLGVAIGSFQAVGAVNVRRMAGYAIVAQVGCVLISLGLGVPAALSAALAQILALAGSALALFGGAWLLPNPATFSALDGLWRRAPLNALAITFGALNLMGAPLTLGFFARFRLIQAGVGGGWWWAAGVVILASLAGVFYGGRVIERMYFRRAAFAHPRVSLWAHIVFAPIALAVIGVIVSGVAPSALLHAADVAVSILPGDIR